MAKKTSKKKAALEATDRRYKAQYQRLGERPQDTEEQANYYANQRARAEKYRHKQSSNGAKQLTVRLQPFEVDLYKSIAKKYGDGNITKSVKDGLLLLEAIRRKPALLDHIYENSSRTTKKSLGELWIYDPV